ncbi:hypothetical protein, conserved [Trypanosoma brucei brucei TREU927]|uniref:Uncharacterized protein n=1 Tax=Trypanosoma brucei brucei (strain 927/4 GUTat10.1) TaxID=185431 RepID=Q580X9_TRYB2|nr:hypothetical protein, conserved [Trypanosoma brucei brucei TREU927]AAX78974.1 hypothetical protein, conserved [Trypanosoma brucei]AAZ13124.1 hypothetical protein, conserved [Trypanosoma brucei brucei TREU927]
MSSVGVSDALEGSRQSKGRTGSIFSGEKMSTTTFGTRSATSLSMDAKASTARMSSTAERVVASNISPCPNVERLRNTAVEDRVLWHVRRRESLQQTKEREQRKIMMERRISMTDYYKTLFRLPPPNSRFNEQQGKAVALPVLQGPMTKAKEKMILESLPKFAHRRVVQDINDYFIAAYYKQNPEALVRKLEEEERQSRVAAATAAAAARNSPTRTGARSQSLGTPSRKNRGGKKKKKKQEVVEEGKPAPNLRLLQSALLTVADSSGIVTLDAFLDMLRQAPFEVRDDEAAENFFSVAHPSSSMSESGVNAVGRLETSHNTAAASSGVRSLSPLKAAQLHHASLHRTIEGSGAGQTSSSNMSVAKMSPVLAGNRGNQTFPIPGVNIPAPVVNETSQREKSPEAHVRELLAGFDALVNGAELKDVIRKLCFSVLETDDYIHKSALTQLRRDGRESCEEPESVLSPSIVKALRDSLDVLHQEEEQAYIRSQLKGRKNRKSVKAASLLPHQKTVIPLNMMRRSHISYEEFCRFFDTMPFLVAAFAHMWLPAFFAPTWPRRKRAASYGLYSDDQDMDDDYTAPTCQEGNEDGTTEEHRGVRDEVDWEKVATPPLRDVLLSALKRRHMASNIVANRLAFMNTTVESPSRASEASPVPS